MNFELLEKRFEGIGARVKFREVVSGKWSTLDGIDIGTDERGEFFDIRIEQGDEVVYDAVDVRPEMRHLLLLARRETRKEKFLCGHDERHWFVCAVPGTSVSSVETAMHALQPREVRWSIHRRLKRIKNRLRRRNKAFVRQGEWFFIPVPELVVNPNQVLRNEPISRGRGSKPHMCQYLFRTGGEPVMVCGNRPTGIAMSEYHNLITSNPNAKNWGWRQMQRDAHVFVSGRVWHKDHKTVVLDGWHRVVMNTENKAPGVLRVVFLD